MPNSPINCYIPSVDRVPNVVPGVKFRVKHFQQILQNLETKNFSDLDGITAIVMVNCAPELAPILAHRFQIQPIPKKYPNVFSPIITHF